MLPHLRILTEILRDVDSNPSKSMMFFTGGSYKQHLTNTNMQQTPTPDCRWVLIVEILQHIDSTYDPGKDASERIDYHEVLARLNENFVSTQGLCWRTHDHHFHIDFHRYVLCPVTCLYEIVEYLERLVKEKYIV